MVCVCLALALSACIASVPNEPRIRVENARLAPAAAGMPGAMMGETPGAGYLTIINEGGLADTLLGVTTDAALLVHLHETRIERDMAHMEAATQVEIPARGRVEFKPGGKHLMLMGLLHDLVPGMEVQLTLNFRRSGLMQLRVPVQGDWIQ